MKRSFLVCALLLGACVVQPAPVRGQTISPVGTWQVSVLGSEKGIIMMTFSNNSTVSGYGITRKQFGFITLAGTWGYNSKGDVVAAYVQTTNGVGTAYAFTAHMLSVNRFRAKATSPGGAGYRCNGEQPESLPNLTGIWNAGLKRKGKPLGETFTATVSSNYLAVFDVTGTGSSEAGTFTLSGEIIASSENKVNAVINRTFGTDIQSSSLSGVFKPGHSSDQIRLQGNDDTGAHLSETATR
jgi:hypothetical protein